MPSRTLAIATMAAALLWGCNGDGGNADPSPRDTPNASNSTSESGATATPNDPDRDGNPSVSMDIASGWSAEITGADDAAELPTTGGPAVLVSRTPAQTTITGMVGQGGGSLTIGLKTFEVGENTAHDFNLGFRLQSYRCISQRVVVTLTQVEPKAKGTFSGPVSCEDLAGVEDPVEATVSGEIAG